jgi:hypothetical protein
LASPNTLKQTLERTHTIRRKHKHTRITHIQNKRKEQKRTEKKKRKEKKRKAGKKRKENGGKKKGKETK